MALAAPHTARTIGPCSPRRLMTCAHANQGRREHESNASLERGDKLLRLRELVVNFSFSYRLSGVAPAINVL